MIGTGATGIQTITEVAKTAGHLTVFQRTAQWSAPLHNSKVTPEEMRRDPGELPGHLRALPGDLGLLHPCRRSSLGVRGHGSRTRGVLGKALWRARLRHLDGQFPRHPGGPRGQRADVRFLARKIRQRVKDPAVAEKLIPKNHGFGTRRVPLESGYFEVYNQPNVKLVDINETPIECITPAGIRTTDAEYEFDIIIYATGFDAITGAFDRIDIRGVDGVSLKEKWQDGPQTFWASWWTASPIS